MVDEWECRRHSKKKLVKLNEKGLVYNTFLTAS